MATFYYSFDDTKNDGSSLHGAEWDALTRIFSSQLQGALRLHGPGVVALPDATSFQVTAGGAGEPFVVNAGSALIKHGVGIVWCLANDETEIPLSALSDGDQNYIHVAVQVAVAVAVGAPDTRENATPIFAVSDEETLDGHELLAQITFEDDAILLVVDRRRFSPALGHNPLLALLFGNGRIAGFDTAIGAPTFDAGTLNITLPAGSQWIISGTFVQLDSDLTIEVPANAAGLWGKLSLDESGLPTVLEDDWLSVAPARGVGVLGNVTSDATQITAFTDTARDIIQTEAAKQQRFEAIEARLTVVEGGGGGGGSTYTGLGLWLPDPGDSRQTYIVIAAMIAALRAELLALIRDGGVRPQQTDLAKLIGENAIMRQEIAKCQLFLRKISGLLDLDLMVELGLERSQSANIVGIPGGTEIYGAGGSVGATFPDHLGASTLTMNDDGTVEP